MDGGEGFDREKRRRGIVLALVLVALVVLVFVMSIVKLGGVPR